MEPVFFQGYGQCGAGLDAQTAPDALFPDKDVGAVVEQVGVRVAYLGAHAAVRTGALVHAGEEVGLGQRGASPKRLTDSM